MDIQRQMNTIKLARKHSSRMLTDGLPAVRASVANRCQYWWGEVFILTILNRSPVMGTRCQYRGVGHGREGSPMFDVPGGRARGSNVWCWGGGELGPAPGRPCTVRSNASWVMVTWRPPSPPLWTDRQTDRHEWKHYLPTTSLVGVKNA